MKETKTPLWACLMTSEGIEVEQIPHNTDMCLAAADECVVLAANEEDAIVQAQKIFEQMGKHK